MADIFISHVEEDAQEALEIALGLEEAGYSTWAYEVDTIPGRSFLLQTREEIDKAKVVLFIISSESLNSRQIESEIVHAHDTGKEFVPLLKNIGFSKFQHRRPDYAQVIGARTSVSIPSDGISSLLPRIIEGLKAMGIHGKSKSHTTRSTQMRIALKSIPLKREEDSSKSDLTEKPAESEVDTLSKPSITLSPKKKRFSAWMVIAPAIVLIAVAMGLTLPKIFNPPQSLISGISNNLAYYIT
jgi:hypothetical protein